MNILIITLSIIVIFLLFILYRTLLGEKTPLVNTVYLPNGVPEIELSKLKITDYSTYTVEFWILVNRLPTSHACAYKPKDLILTDGTKTNNHNGLYNGSPWCPDGGSIFYIDENLCVDLFSNGTFTCQNNRYDTTYGKIPSVMSLNFPVQKWTHVCISIQNNSLIDLYINGKLIQSAKYDGLTRVNTMSKPSSSQILRFGKHLDASLTKLYITAKSTDKNTVWKNYLKGPGLKTNFNLGVSLTQNGLNTANINLL